MPATVIRPRQTEDLPGCVEALAGVHTRDGYPVRWPADTRQWLTLQRLLGAWIAEAGDGGGDGNAVVGHVALTEPGEQFAAGVGFPASELALVGRLYVAVEARRGGVASELLAFAVKAATGLGRRAALEVDAAARGAVALYEREGWRFVRAAEGDWIAADGLPARVRIYLAPENLEN